MAAIRLLDVLAIVTIGLLAVAATFLFAAATTFGLLSVVSVIGALYPVTTVGTAMFVLRERIHALQRTGAIGALVGVGFISV